MPDLMREVMGLVPSKLGIFRWVDRTGQITNEYYTLSVRPGNVDSRLHAAALEKRAAAEGIIKSFDKAVTNPAAQSVTQIGRGNAILDPTRFQRSDFYNLIWRSAGVFDGLSMLLKTSGRPIGLLYVFRGVRDPPVEPSDVNVLRSIVGFAEHCMICAKSEDGTFAEGGERALSIVTRNGMVRHAGVVAQLLLKMALVPRWSPTNDWGRLCQPAPEIVWLCQTLAATANGESGQPPVLRLQNPWGEFVLRAYWLEPTDGGEQTRHIGITIERRVPRALALHRRVEDLPLTHREKQLCLLMAHDRSRRDLADAMGVSTGTIITHQSNIYAKLDVHSRAELLSALLPV